MRRIGWCRVIALTVAPLHERYECEADRVAGTPRQHDGSALTRHQNQTTLFATLYVTVFLTCIPTSLIALGIHHLSRQSHSTTISIGSRLLCLFLEMARRTKNILGGTNVALKPVTAFSTSKSNLRNRCSRDGWSVTGVLGQRRAVAQELKSEPPTARVAEFVQFGLHLAGATLYQSLSTLH